MALNTLIFFNCCSQCLQTCISCGLNYSFWGKDLPYTALPAASNSSFSGILEEVFTVFHILNWSTQSTSTWISAIRWWISFLLYLQNISARHCRWTSYCYCMAYFGDNISRTSVGTVQVKFLLGCPFNNLPSPRFWETHGQGAGRWETLGTRLPHSPHPDSSPRECCLETL